MVMRRFEEWGHDLQGFWSIADSMLHTATIDWCERNYVVNSYIAEFWNTLSSLSLFIFGLVGLIRARKFQVEYRFRFSLIAMMAVGIGSALFHGTLTYFGQMLDELPMVYSMTVWAYTLYRMNDVIVLMNTKGDPALVRLKYEKEAERIAKGKAHIDWFPPMAVLYCVFVTFVHGYMGFTTLFQLNFSFLVFAGLMNLFRLYRLEMYRFPHIKRLIKYYLGLLLVAGIAWILDQHACPHLHDLRFHIGDSEVHLPNPQLHAVWHVVIALDTYVGLTVGEAIRVLAVRYGEEQKAAYDAHQSLHIQSWDYAPGRDERKYGLHIDYYWGFIPNVRYSLKSL